MISLFEVLENIKEDANYSSIRKIVKENLVSFMIGDEYPNHYYLDVTKTSAAAVLNYMELFIRTKDVTQKQILDTLMSFDVSVLENAQLFMDYIYSYERGKNNPDRLLILDTQKLFNKLRTEMPIEYRNDYPIAKRIEILQEKGLDFKW